MASPIPVIAGGDRARAVLLKQPRVRQAPGLRLLRRRPALNCPVRDLLDAVWSHGGRRARTACGATATGQQESTITGTRADKRAVEGDADGRWRPTGSHLAAELTD
jgi:hypothetical protein